MGKCLICLSPRRTLIKVNSEEWKNLQISFLIDKHLWPMEYDTKTGVCKRCWQKLVSFHEFFVDVQKLHKVLVLKNFNTIENEEFQKVLKEIYNDKKVQNASRLEKEIYQHSNYIKTLEEDLLTEPNVVSEPFDDDTIDNNPNPFSIIESETQDLEKNPLDLDLCLENKGSESVEDITKNIANTEIDTNYLENSSADLLVPLGSKDITNKSAVHLTQINEASETMEENKNTDKNLEDATNIDNNVEEDDNLQNDFSDSASSWTNNEVNYDSEDSSKELVNTMNQTEDNLKELENNEKTNKIYVNHLNKQQKCREDDLSVLEIPETIDDIQEKYHVDAFIAKYLKLICDACQTPMETFNKLMQHFKNEHNISGYVMCCGKKYNRRSTLRDHLLLHNNPNQFKCFQCNLMFSSRYSFIIHNKKQHKLYSVKTKYKDKIDKNDAYIAKHYKLSCCLCKISVKTFFELSQHFEKEHDVSAYVICCGIKISQRWHLYDHVITHNNPNHFKCTKCNEVFENRVKLNYHMRSHEDNKLQCNICNAIVKGKGQLAIHKAQHLTNDEKKHACPECGKRFAFKHRLRVHTRIVHEQVNKRVCEICGISYKSINALKAHMIKRHMDKPAPTVNCDICGLKLSSTSVLGRHKKIRHSKDNKEYTCDVCSKVSIGIYAHKWHVVLHKRKKHKCQICGKSFVKPISLRNHIATHTGGEAPYKCPWCPKTFNSHGNAFTHRKQKHYKEWLELRRSKYVDGKLPIDEENKLQRDDEEN